MRGRSVSEGTGKDDSGSVFQLDVEPDTMASVGAKFGSRHRAIASDKNCVLRTKELKANSKAEVELTEL